MCSGIAVINSTLHYLEHSQFYWHTSSCFKNNSFLIHCDFSQVRITSSANFLVSILLAEKMGILFWHPNDWWEILQSLSLMKRALLRRKITLERKQKETICCASLLYSCRALAFRGLFSSDWLVWDSVWKHSSHQQVRRMVLFIRH